MPTTPAKNLLYRAALPILAPHSRGQMTHHVFGHPLTTLPNYEQILAKHRIEKLPIVDGENNLKGLITIKDIEKSTKYPNSAKDQKGRLLCGAAVGITKDSMLRVEALVNAKVDVISIDSAHAHNIEVINKVRELRAAFPDLCIIAVRTYRICEFT